MPHFGLMEERTLGPVEGPRLRAQLHLRGGKRRLREGKIAAGIVTLYDAVTAAMESYAARRERRGNLSAAPGENLNDEKVLYRVLIRSGVLDGKFDFEAFDRLTEKALTSELPGYDYTGLLKGIEAIMVTLEVMPFDESALPPEHPGTF